MPYVKNPGDRSLELIESRVEKFQKRQPGLEIPMSETRWREVRSR
jgi:hypothetical protein